ncbi:MAG: DUF697 domain-containing protein [Eubacteriales bacterium]|nr:DUF697 domain-containing protein [Eubacteriales bacterium]
MNRIKKTHLGILLATSLLIVLIIFMINQCLSLASFLSFGEPRVQLVLSILFLIVIFSLLGFPIWLFYRYPQREALPEDRNSRHYSVALDKQLRGLKRNRFLRQSGHLFDPELDLEIQVQLAQKRLSIEANRLIRAEASSVFLSTAISQNGVLDAAFVVVSLFRLIYRLTRLYENRPQILKIIKIYNYILAAIFLARSIEDLDLIEAQLEPMISALVSSSMLAMIPGAKQISQIVITSLAEGSVNALLCLRVGVMCRRLLSSHLELPKRELRREASIEASGLFIRLVRENGSAIVRVVGRCFKDLPKNIVRRKRRDNSDDCLTSVEK